MRTLLVASLLALPVLAAGAPRATAGNGCYNLAGSFHIKICATGKLNCWKEPFSSCGGGGGSHGGCGGCYDPSGLQAPGPWYLYWPYGGAGQPMAGAPAYGGAWDYSMHFNAPAPMGSPYFAAPLTLPPGFGAGSGGGAPAPAYQPVSYYPQYWYGH